MEQQNAFLQLVVTNEINIRVPFLDPGIKLLWLKVIGKLNTMQSNCDAEQQSTKRTTSIQKKLQVYLVVPAI